MSDMSHFLAAIFVGMDVTKHRHRLWINQVRLEKERPPPQSIYSSLNDNLWLLTYYQHALPNERRSLIRQWSKTMRKTPTKKLTIDLSLRTHNKLDNMSRKLGMSKQNTVTYVIEEVLKAPSMLEERKRNAHAEEVLTTAYERNKEASAEIIHEEMEALKKWLSKEHLKCT
ncbi:hypothetical protein F9L16_23265 [Agarivorans sp. B2Z047]|uniref:hypothetical protein n=1 Tax=Agarivorans sp. B2Z047 TaxID=2652721 RepID=UPI00128BCE5E|nr:hypothetical protein [Agarivorans sp. B2Z047]MPW31879.1 hypothetical protein [Agarivorans sp. B2Z047]UQN43676.1 hypothetical protein LQZ07_04155 [Agarivorans sp. B2Z047]